jgi:DivIVA domain-containing protein
VVNADEVRNIKFRKGIYDQSDVNELLGRIASEIDAGRRAGPLIVNAAFHQRPIRGYDARAVDWFLDQVQRHEDPDEVARINADPWRDLAADPYHQAGNKVARYRLARDEASSRKGIQISVHPRQQLTELTIALALSAPRLGSYFRSEGGG